MNQTIPTFIHLLTYLICGLYSLGQVGCQSSQHPPSDRTKVTTARNTTQAQQLTYEALTLMKSGHLDDAEKCLNQAIEADIMFGPAHNNLGKIYFKQNRHYEAAWEFQYAAKLLPARPEPKNNLGLVFESTGRWQQAEDQYKLAAEIAPQSAEFLGNLIRSRIKAGYRDQKTLDLLVKLIDREQRPHWQRWARKQQILIQASLQNKDQTFEEFQSGAPDSKTDDRKDVDL